ncbi:TPA: S1 family peptidase [Staphylococcus pseudintermedius]
MSSISVVNGILSDIQSVAQAEHHTTEIHDATIAPYNALVAFNTATGVVVGKNTIITNKHVAKKNQPGDRLTAHPTGTSANGGIYFIKNIVPYPGNADLAVVHVYEKSEDGRNFNEQVKALPFAKNSTVGERISIVGYPNLIKNQYKLFESTGNITQINGNRVTTSAFAEKGNSGSPIINANGEIIGLLYGGQGKESSETTYGVYLTDPIKNFIWSQIEK